MWEIIRSCISHPLFYADARTVKTGLLDQAVRRGACDAHTAFEAAVIRRDSGWRRCIAVDAKKDQDRIRRVTPRMLLPV